MYLIYQVLKNRETETVTAINKVSTHKSKELAAKKLRSIFNQLGKKGGLPVFIDPVKGLPYVNNYTTGKVKEVFKITEI